MRLEAGSTTKCATAPIFSVMYSMTTQSLHTENQKSISHCGFNCFFPFRSLAKRTLGTALIHLLFFFLVEELPIRPLQHFQLHIFTQTLILQSLLKLRNTKINKDFSVSHWLKCVLYVFHAFWNVWVICGSCTLYTKQIVPMSAPSRMLWGSF